MQRINRTVWISEQKKLGTEIKWFGKIPLETSASFFMIEDYQLIKTPKMIGACFLYNIDSKVDCSFFISPNERRKGYARSFILDISSKFDNIQFTVSKYNVQSIQLFNSIKELMASDIQPKTQTITYKTQH